jgi:LemA protein
MIFFGLIAACIVLILMAVFSYNSLIQLRNQVRNAWKQIDIQLKRRHDLIPNLVNAVRGQMKFEKETLEAVVTARSSAMSAKGIEDTMKKEGELSSAISRLLAVAENYPALQSNESARQLMEELTTTENQVTFARQFYNDIATRFDTKLELFPTNLFASSFGFRLVPLFEIAEQQERDVPVVNLTMKQ